VEEAIALFKLNSRCIRAPTIRTTVSGKPTWCTATASWPFETIAKSLALNIRQLQDTGAGGKTEAKLSIQSKVKNEWTCLLTIIAESLKDALRLA
jgi:hypothetical protein